jgi:hypothetical protein
LSSNLEKVVEKGLQYAQNLRLLWVSSCYSEKQRLQCLVFPEGMMYDKQRDEVLTTRVNSLFGEIALLSSGFDKKKATQIQIAFWEVK